MPTVELEQLFKQAIQGEVRFDSVSRYLYSTDASIYQIEPLGVIIPKHVDDVRETARIMRENKVSLVARGGGTSLGGQTVGAGVQLDFSKYLNRILEINPEEAWARVEPGVVLDQLNQALLPFQLWFGPDVATSNRATLGGMVGNNSSGVRSIIYGKTVDHVLELEVILASGEEVTLKGLSAQQLKLRMSLASQEGAIYRHIRLSAEQHRQEIVQRFPKILRRVSGYNLDECLDPNDFNLAKLIVGSEGTLALIKSIKLHLNRRPPYRGLGIIYCHDLHEALDAVNPLLETQPSAVELMDHLLLSLARDSLAYSRKLHFMEKLADALLMVEYLAESEAELLDKLDKLQQFVRLHRLGFHFSTALDAATQADIWAIRKAGLPLLYGIPGQRKPIAFVEDTAVAPEKLPEFVRRFSAIVAEHGTTAAYYAHASAGCLHIRPLLDLKQVDDVQRMKAISEAIFELVLEYGGSMSGEHGDGLARSEYIPRMFGPTLYQAFQELKNIFDPHHLLNPGKIVNAPAMTENLRFGDSYHPTTPNPFLSFAKEEGFNNLIELCNGCGGCRKVGTGTMCPTYMATRDEDDSTRGRANALRKMLVDGASFQNTDESRLYKIMDLCIGCKACKAECPSKVDMAKLKTEFLYQYQKKNGLSLRQRLLAHPKWLNHMGALFAPFSNWSLQFKPLKYLLAKGLGFSPQRYFPAFAPIPFEFWFQKEHRSPPGQAGTVVLFNDCFMNYNYPGNGQAVVKILEAFGYRVLLPPQQCCGRPLLSLGLLDEAKAAAQTLLYQFQSYLDQGFRIIGSEPSCLLSFRDEYPDLLGPSAQALAHNSLLLPEWISQQVKAGNNPFQEATTQKQILFHEHCHQKALVGSEISLQALNLPPHYQAQLIQAGCCGMAGAFGYEAEHFKLSMAIGADRLFPAVAQASAEVEICVSGVSCHQQVMTGTQRKPRFLAQVLADALDE